MSQKPTVIFVCEHGAAKSIVAAAYFNKIAEEKGLDLKALARGTNPEVGLSHIAVTALLEDGLTPTQSTPEKLLPEELETARQVISFCKLPEGYQQKNNIEEWNDVPSVSENYQTARDAIRAHIKHLVNDLNSKRS